MERVLDGQSIIGNSPKVTAYAGGYSLDATAEVVPVTEAAPAPADTRVPESQFTPKSVVPSAEEIAAARQEYNALFVYVDDETKRENAKRYQRGLQDAISKNEDRRNTDDAKFFGYIQWLLDLANRDQDHPSRSS